MWGRRVAEPRGGRRKGFSPRNMWSLNVIFGENTATFWWWDSEWHSQEVLLTPHYIPLATPCNSVPENFCLTRGASAHRCCKPGLPDINNPWEQSSKSNWWGWGWRWGESMITWSLRVYPSSQMTQASQLQLPQWQAAWWCTFVGFFPFPSLLHSHLSYCPFLESPPTWTTWAQILVSGSVWGEPQPGELHS